MKYINISNSIEPHDIFEKSKSIFPDYKISMSGKKNILIRNKAVMVVVSKRKDKLKFHSDLNYSYTNNLILLFLGILIGIIGVIFVLITLYIIYNKKRKNLHKEVFLKLNT